MNAERSTALFTVENTRRRFHDVSLSYKSHCEQHNGSHLVHTGTSGSEVQIRIDVWAALHIFQLFVVLVEPPTDLGLNAIEGLQDYLTQL